VDLSPTTEEDTNSSCITLLKADNEARSDITRGGNGAWMKKKSHFHRSKEATNDEAWMSGEMTLGPKFSQGKIQ